MQYFVAADAPVVFWRRAVVAAAKKD